MGQMHVRQVSTKKNKERKGIHTNFNALFSEEKHFVSQKKEEVAEKENIELQTVHT